MQDELEEWKPQSPNPAQPEYSQEPSEIGVVAERAPNIVHPANAAKPLKTPDPHIRPFQPPAEL